MSKRAKHRSSRALVLTGVVAGALMPRAVSAGQELKPVELHFQDVGEYTLEVHVPGVQYVELTRTLHDALGGDFEATSEPLYLLSPGIELVGVETAKLPDRGVDAPPTSVEMPVLASLASGAYCERVDISLGVDDRSYSYSRTQCFAVTEAGESSPLLGDELFNRFAQLVKSVDAKGAETLELVGGGFAYDAEHPEPTEIVVGPSEDDPERPGHVPQPREEAAK